MKENRLNRLTILHLTTLLSRAENHWPIERVKRIKMKENRFDWLNPLTILHLTTLPNRAENHWAIERMKRIEMEENRLNRLNRLNPLTILRLSETSFHASRLR